MGLLRDRAGGLAASRNNRFLCPVAGVAVQGAGHDHGQTLQGALHRFVAVILHAHAGGGPGIHDFGVPILGKPLDNRVRDGGAHAVHRGQTLAIRLADSLHRTELGRKRTGGGRTHVANREGNQHAPQRLLLSLLQLGEEVQRILRGLRLGARLGRLGVEVGHALHLSGAHAIDLLLTFDSHITQVLGGQVEEMRLGGQRRGVRGCGAGERLGGLEAQRLNVEGAAACRVVHALGQLCRAGAGVRATQVHVPFLAGGQRRTAGGALAGHDELAFSAVTQGDHGGDDFGDHVACLAQHHGVADEHALSLDHVLVVQGGSLHGRARDKHGLHDAVGGHAAGASHVHADVQQLGVHLFGRVLVRHGPARHARGIAQLRLGCEIVDLDDDAVNLVHEGVALLAVAVDEVEDAPDRIGQLAIGAHGQAPGGEQVVGLKLGGNLQAGARTNAVHVHAQRSGSGHRRVLLAQ